MRGDVILVGQEQDASEDQTFTASGLLRSEALQRLQKALQTCLGQQTQII